MIIDWRIFLKVNFPQCEKCCKEKPNFLICMLHLRNILDIEPSRSNISGHQYSSVSLFEVFQGLLSVTLLPAMKILFFNTFLYVRIQSIYGTSTMYFAIIVQLLIPVNWFLFPQNNQKLSLQMLTCLHEYTGS